MAGRPTVACVGQAPSFATARRALLCIDPIVTDVELPSTVPSSQQTGWPRRAALVAGAVVTVLSCVLGVASRSAVADPLASARAQATQITAQLATDQRRLDTTSEQYDAAQQQLQQIGQQIVTIRAAVVQDKAQVGADTADLRAQAVSSYMSGTSDSDLQTLFSTGGEQAAVAGEYQSVASGNISGAIDSLSVAQTHLATQQSQLQSAQNQAQSALDEASTARQSAQATIADQQATLARVKGEIGTLVAQRQAAQLAASHAAFLARVAQAAADTPAPATSPGGSNDPGRPRPVPPNLPSAGGAGTALAAAESQIGVPYVWGGESPGGGFDCSGLTQWAWRQAGVDLPRTAAAQYDAIAHVPLSDLQPGDLLFWGFGGISHVGMYVGGGEIVNAPYTGTVVRVEAIWNSGLVGAGRP
jgi:cell wall-associated NlpC family hydrolase